MTDRYTIQREAEHKLAQAEHALHKLRSKASDAGEEASQDMADAVAAAERTLEKGKAKLGQLAAATDDEFDKLWGETKDAWHQLAHDAERGWDKLSDRVKSYFA
jgi:phage shock protein A